LDFGLRFIGMVELSLEIGIIWMDDALKKGHPRSTDGLLRIGDDHERFT